MAERRTRLKEEQVRKRGLPPLMGESGGKPPFLTCSIFVSLDRYLLAHQLFFALAFPELPQLFCVELAAGAVAKVYDLVPDARRDEPVCLGPRHALRHLLEFLDFEKASDARSDVAVLDERRSLRHRFVGALEIHRQYPNARMQREISNDGLEVGHDSRHRTRSFRKDERVVTTIEKRLRVTQRLSQRTRALHRHEIRKVLHHRAFVLRVEEVVSSCERNEIFAKLAERHLRQTHVEVRTMIRSDEEVRVRRNVRTSFVVRAQKLIVKELLQEVGGLVSRGLHERRHMNLVVLLLLVNTRLLLRRGVWLARDDGQQFSHVLNLVETFRSRDRAAGILDSGRKLDEH